MSKAYLLAEDRRHMIQKYIPRWGLVCSICCNIALAAYFVVLWQEGFLWIDREHSFSEEPTKDIEEPLVSALLQLNGHSDEALISLLDDAKIVANGYRTQEIALSLLGSRGYQVQDALCAIKITAVGSLLLPEGKSVQLYPSVQQAEIEAVKLYLRSHKVPFSAEEIVRRLPRIKEKELYIEALVRSDEWALFSQLFPSLSQEKQLKIVEDLGKESFSAVISTPKKEVGRFFLDHFSIRPSPFVAELLALEYSEDTVNLASDELVLSILAQVTDATDAGIRLSIKLLRSQRKPHIWKAVQEYLAQAVGRPSLATMTREEVFAWCDSLSKTKKESFVTSKKISQPASATASEVSKRAAVRQLTPYQVYTARKGDTLWSIAKRFHVNVDKLKYLNGIKGTKVEPGTKLKIPH